MGLLDTWKVSGITTEAAKVSYPFHLLANAVDTNEEQEISTDELVAVAQAFIAIKGMFSQYFDGGEKKYKKDAVTFLVFLASYMRSKDGFAWDWFEIRHLSQGLYESMEKSPAHFLHYNTPIIDRVISEVNDFIYHNT
jgi:hypothetical protein